MKTYKWSESLSANTSSARLSIGDARQVIATLAVTAADRTNSDETYDFYLVTGDGTSEWDLVHFPQIAANAAKTYTTVVNSDIYGTTVASNNATAVQPGQIRTDTAGANEAIRTLTAGMTRHGMIGSKLGYELVVGGTSPGPVAFSVVVTAK